MIKLGDNNVTLKLGDNDVSKVYLGENQIYPSAPATNLVMQRISNTEYLVTGDSGTADLTFTRESDSFVDAKGVQGLPYTFTHTAGEKWSVNGVNAWAVDIPLGGYLEAQNASDLDFNDYMEISLLIDPQSDIGTEIPTFFGKVQWDQDDDFRWGVYSRSSSGGAVVLFSKSGTNSFTFNGGDAPLYNKWYSIKSELDGVNYSISLNDIKLTNTIDLNAIPYTTTNFFRIGRAYTSKLEDRLVGKVQSYKHGTEVFDMNEGSGTTTVGSEGTILNLVGGSNWVKI